MHVRILELFPAREGCVDVDWHSEINEIVVYKEKRAWAPPPDPSDHSLGGRDLRRALSSDSVSSSRTWRQLVLPPSSLPVRTSDPRILFAAKKLLFLERTNELDFLVLSAERYRQVSD